MKNDIIYWIWYQNIHGINSGTKIKLLEFAESPREIFKTAGKCLQSGNVSSTIINKIAEFATVAEIEKYLPVPDKDPDMGIVSYYDFGYPKLLSEIHNPPIVLYYKGNIDLLNNRCIAIVGTRNATDSGKYHARSFAREFASTGYTVVGGMSIGIETAAHMGAIGVGATCAVVPGGINVVYPKENRELYNSICKNGVVISEHLPGDKVSRFGIPLRNRLISGISESVLLIEAPEKSGSITTVNHAVEQNRDVYVLDDKSNAPEFKGNRILIEEGAVAVTNPYDIINNTEYTAYDSVNRHNLLHAAEHVANIPGCEEPKALPDDLSPEEMSVITLIREGIKQFDEIAMNSNLSVADVGYALTMLEFKGIITQKLGKVYEEI